jgi:hypothetical protein
VYQRSCYPYGIACIHCELLGAPLCTKIQCILPQTHFGGLDKFVKHILAGSNTTSFLCFFLLRSPLHTPLYTVQRFLTMTTAPNTPAPSEGAFEMPPSAAVATDHRNKVTWTSKTKENAAPTVEIRTFPVKYEASANLSIVNVLKTTLTMFAKTDPVVAITSRVDESIKFKKAADFDALPAARLSELFPGEIIFGRTHVRLFMT